MLSDIASGSVAGARIEVNSGSARLPLPWEEFLSAQVKVLKVPAEGKRWLARTKLAQNCTRAKSGGRQEARTPDLRVANAGGRKGHVLKTPIYLPRMRNGWRFCCRKPLVAVRFAMAKGALTAETRYARLRACGTHYALTSGIPSAVCDGLRLSL